MTRLVWTQLYEWQVRGATTIASLEATQPLPVVVSRVVVPVPQRLVPLPRTDRQGQGQFSGNWQAGTNTTHLVVVSGEISARICVVGLLISRLVEVGVWDQDEGLDADQHLCSKRR